MVRLRSTRDFRELYTSGRKKPGRLFVLFMTLRQDQLVRLGVTASRRVGNAVKRNRAKRLMREAVRMILPEIHQGMDLVLVARPGIPASGILSVHAQLRSQLETMNLLIRPGNGEGE
ncbi:ribonuclease P protein component [bacterium]|nr:ribonuclease P protein component [candidate division CSSED10-310 bacterium]